MGRSTDNHFSRQYHNNRGQKNTLMIYGSGERCVAMASANAQQSPQSLSWAFSCKLRYF